MSITDELRDWVSNHYSGWTSKQAVGFAIADRIDERIEREYIKLPVDVDGEYIRIGDAMVLQHEVKEKPYVVQGLTWDGEDWYFTCDEGFFNACGWMHHHEPTVEDVLREFANRVCNSGHQWGLDAADTIAEYAGKLRLVGDAE